MSKFEEIILGIISAAPAALPLFVHSERGLVIGNASEALLAAILTQLAPKAPTA